VDHSRQSTTLSRPLALSSSTEPMEIKCKREHRRIFGVLVIAALTIQTAAAATRHTQKVARNPTPTTHQLRDAFDSAPEAVGRKSCDVIWCYEN